MPDFVGRTTSAIPSREEYLDLKDELEEKTRELDAAKDAIKSLRRQLRVKESSGSSAADLKVLQQAQGRIQDLQQKNYELQSKLRGIVDNNRRIYRSLSDFLRSLNLDGFEWDAPSSAGEKGTEPEKTCLNAMKLPSPFESQSYGVRSDKSLGPQRQFPQNLNDIGGFENSGFNTGHTNIRGAPQDRAYQFPPLANPPEGTLFSSGSLEHPTLFGSPRFGSTTQFGSLTPSFITSYRASSPTAQEYTGANTTPLPPSPRGTSYMSPSQTFKRGQGGLLRGTGFLARGAAGLLGRRSQMGRPALGGPAKSPSDPNQSQPTLTTAMTISEISRIKGVEHGPDTLTSPMPEPGKRKMPVSIPHESPAKSTMEDIPSLWVPYKRVKTTTEHGTVTQLPAPTSLILVDEAPSNYAVAVTDPTPAQGKAEPDSDPDDEEMRRRAVLQLKEEGIEWPPVHDE
ncbi:MAG: hypothetical protein L6R39_001766 [Caloplaca ligustica]|nr:MAG: hypothetical protein L6R39_001766 [Caloplaca ligustica]